MQKWKRARTLSGIRYRSALAPHEAALLLNLGEAMIGLLDNRESSAPVDELEELTGITTGHSEPPADPTLTRLLPDFYRPPRGEDSDEAAVSFNAAMRSLHEREIIDAKRAAAQSMLDTLPLEGGRLELTEEVANAWVAAVNDMRLTLGVLLEIGPMGATRLPEDHPHAPHYDVYQWLTVLQEYLVLALMGSR